MVDLKQTVAEFKNQMEDLKEKCKDLEGQMRRGNIRITGVDEKPGSSSTTAVSKLLKEILQMDKAPQVDRSHRSLAPRRPGGRPRVIIAKMHYYQECMDILKRARERALLSYDGQSVAIYPD